MANSISGKDGKREMICSFCGRSQSQVDQLIIGPGVNICKDCIDMCYSALYKDASLWLFHLPDGSFIRSPFSSRS